MPSGDDDPDATGTAVDSPARPATRTASHFVYVLECADGSFYTGYTTDVARRVAEHNAGDGAKYTRGRTPVDLVYQERHETRSAAMSREYELKQLSRPQKERLVHGEA